MFSIEIFLHNLKDSTLFISVFLTFIRSYFISTLGINLPLWRLKRCHDSSDVVYNVSELPKDVLSKKKIHVLASFIPNPFISKDSNPRLNIFKIVLFPMFIFFNMHHNIPWFLAYLKNWTIKIEVYSSEIKFEEWKKYFVLDYLSTWHGFNLALFFNQNEFW